MLCLQNTQITKQKLPILLKSKQLLFLTEQSKSHANCNRPFTKFGGTKLFSFSCKVVSKRCAFLSTWVTQAIKSMPGSISDTGSYPTSPASMETSTVLLFQPIQLNGLERRYQLQYCKRTTQLSLNNKQMNMGKKKAHT